MTISASAVKELRETTGAGMMDCKAALTATDGDMEKAIDWLRAKGLAKAAKKAGRVAAEGLVAVATGDRSAAVAEVNSETDFVARNEEFQKLAIKVAETALKGDGSSDTVRAARLEGSTGSVDDEVKKAVATIGENLTFRRSARLSVEDGVVASYIHGQVAPGLGRIGVLVGVRSKGDAGKLRELGRQVAMHIAATNPLAVRVAELDPVVVERERGVFSQQARDSGKPEVVIGKMVEGRLRKFYEEKVLLEQAFVVNPDQTVGAAVKQLEKDLGTPVEVTQFMVFKVGEGIEKEATDFAAEVAKAAGPKT